MSAEPTRDPRTDPEPAPRLSRVARLTLLFLAAAAAVGVAATVHGLLETDFGLGAPRPAMLVAAGGVAVATAANLLVRFVRWQFLLRRLGVRVPSLPSLGAFFGSFAFLPIPLYLGQLVARVRLTPLATGSRRGVVLVALGERALDAWALLVLALPALPAALAIPAAAVAIAAAVPAVQRRAVAALARLSDQIALLLLEPPRTDPSRATAEPPAAVAPAPLPRSAIAIAGALSLGAWLVPCVALLAPSRAAGLALGPIAATSFAAASILAGAVSLVPLGAGVSGLLLLGFLEPMARPAAAAATVVFLFRAATVWLTLALGAAALVVHHRRARSPAAADHFDDIDSCYDAWLPEHFRGHVVGKKLAAMRRHVGDVAGARGLDIGCGRGWYFDELARAGAQMVGLDPSTRQLAAARRSAAAAPARLVRGTVLELPFAPASFDFAYVINVLHHLPSVADQHRALAGAARVLRPGGRLFVHEMNVVNPLFRGYLGYVFPILKGIEEGTEHYLDARRLPAIPGFRLVAVEYFTFAPDFTPPALLPAVAAVEARLERGALQRYAAHFMAVFERE